MAKLVFNNMKLNVDKGKVNYSNKEKFTSKALDGVTFDIIHLAPGEEALYVDGNSKIDFRKLVSEKVEGIKGLEAEVNGEVFKVEDIDTLLSFPDTADGGKIISTLIYEVSARIMNSSYLTQDEVKN